MDDVKVIPTLDSIYAAARIEELKKRRADPEHQNAPPAAAPVASIGAAKPLIRFGEMFTGGQK